MIYMRYKISRGLNKVCISSVSALQRIIGRNSLMNCLPVPLPKSSSICEYSDLNAQFHEFTNGEEMVGFMNVILSHNTNHECGVVIHEQIFSFSRILERTIKFLTKYPVLLSHQLICELYIPPSQGGTKALITLYIENTETWLYGTLLV